MHKQKERFRQCEKLVKKAKNEAPPGGVIGCRKCSYYMPEFKYRKCMYATCPYGQDREVFRKKPLKHVDFYRKEVVTL